MRNYLYFVNVLSSVPLPGPTCEEAVDPCELLECTNGGVCETLGDSATCDCPIGYGGLCAITLYHYPNLPNLPTLEPTLQVLVCIK